MTSPTGKRLRVRLRDPRLLTQWMEFRDHTIRSLAAAVDRHPSMIGFLHSGHRGTCSAELAKRIERELDCPAGTLFVATVSAVVCDERQRVGEVA